MKKIYCAKYNGNIHDSELVYEDEIASFKNLILKIRSGIPTITDDEAYLALKNHISSINSYVIVDDDQCK